MFAPCARACFQRSSPATAASRCTKREATVGAPRELGRIGQDHLVGAERLREVMRRERDAPLRQIEAELVAHRAAEPGIGPRLRRPDAFDQAAEHDAIDVLQPRFERAVDAHAHARDRRPPHHAVGDRDLEQLGIVRRRDGKAGVGVARAMSSNASSSFTPSLPAKAAGSPCSSAAQGGDDVAMACGELGEGVRRAGQGLPAARARPRIARAARPRRSSSPSLR